MVGGQRRLIIGAICLSPPGTMGGNTKIVLEIARHLRTEREVHVIVPESRVRTVTDNLPDLAGVTLHPIGVYPKSDLRHPFGSSAFYCREMGRALAEMKAGAGDDFLSCQDFYTEVVPAFRLQRRFGYRWFPSAFLFVPGPVENLRKRYGFPVVPYALAWAYARAYVFLSRFRATGYVITNETDFVHFPKRFRAGRLFPFYGGVNVEQIPDGGGEKTRDVVFCSRLCAQKGIMGFLDVWKLVHDRVPKARFTLIGNGAADFERALRGKAVRLGVDGTIDWLGYVNNEEKYAIYRSARVMVHPTVFDNNGMVAAEALCSGLPVVMYDLPALRKVYDVGCVKVPFGDKRAFAEAVVKLLEEPAAAAPTAGQVAELRRRWAWGNRVRAFADWLGKVGG